jgi:hypothetical protein
LNNQTKADNLYKATESGFFSTYAVNNTSASKQASQSRPFQKATRVIQVNQGGVID